MIRTVQVIAEYVAGGGMNERYEGTAEFGLNVMANDSLASVEEQARERAKLIISRRGCWHQSVIDIKNVSIQ